MFSSAAAALAAASELLQYDRHALLAGQLWRLWTCHLVHYSLQHALTDAAVVLVAGLIVAEAGSTRRLLLALALGAPFISLGLLLIAPDCLYYRGASGIAVMLVALAIVTLWPRAGPASRTALVLVAIGLGAKIAAEAMGVNSGLGGLPADVAIAWQAHLLGAAAGAVVRAGATGVARTVAAPGR